MIALSRSHWTDNTFPDSAFFGRVILSQILFLKDRRGINNIEATKLSGEEASLSGYFGSYPQDFWFCLPVSKSFAYFQCSIVWAPTPTTITTICATSQISHLHLWPSFIGLYSAKSHLWKVKRTIDNLVACTVTQNFGRRVPYWHQFSLWTYVMHSRSTEIWINQSTQT